MPIKKSAIFLMLLSLSSVGLLVYSSALTPSEMILPVATDQCSPLKCCTQTEDTRAFTPWEMISQLMLRSAA